MPFAYIVQCCDGSYYVGSTVDLERRLAQHNTADEGPVYTRRRRPVRLAWAAEFARIDDAYAYEKQVQGWNRRKREALISGAIGELPALASRAWRHREVPT